MAVCILCKDDGQHLLCADIFSTKKNVIVTNIKFHHITIPKHNEKSLMTQYIHVAGVHHQYKLYIIKVVTDLAITKTCKNTLFNFF